VLLGKKKRLLYNPLLIITPARHVTDDAPIQKNLYSLLPRKAASAGFALADSKQWDLLSDEQKIELSSRFLAQGRSRSSTTTYLL